MTHFYLASARASTHPQMEWAIWCNGTSAYRHRAEFVLSRIMVICTVITSKLRLFCAGYVTTGYPAGYTTYPVAGYYLSGQYTITVYATFTIRLSTTSLRPQRSTVSNLYKWDLLYRKWCQTANIVGSAEWGVLLFLSPLRRILVTDMRSAGISVEVRCANSCCHSPNLNVDGLQYVLEK